MTNLFRSRKSSASPVGRPNAQPAERPDDIDFAWRVHAAIQDWAKNVDQKASITLAVVTAIGGFAAAQVFGDKGSLHAVHGDQLWAVRVMGIAFLAAGFSALHAVFPSLKRRRTRKLASSGLIYFGHLRHQSADDIVVALEHLDEGSMRRQLATQIEATSGIAWRKHARLQRAHVLLVIAILAFAVAESWG